MSAAAAATMRTHFYLFARAHTRFASESCARGAYSHSLKNTCAYSRTHNTHVREYALRNPFLDACNLTRRGSGGGGTASRRARLGVQARGPTRIHSRALASVSHPWIFTNAFAWATLKHYPKTIYLKCVINRARAFILSCWCVWRNSKCYTKCVCSFMHRACDSHNRAHCKSISKLF